MAYLRPTEWETQNNEILEIIFWFSLEERYMSSQYNQKLLLQVRIAKMFWEYIVYVQGCVELYFSLSALWLPLISLSMSLLFIISSSFSYSPNPSWIKKVRVETLLLVPIETKSETTASLKFMLKPPLHTENHQVSTFIISNNTQFDHWNRVVLKLLAQFFRIIQKSTTKRTHTRNVRRTRRLMGDKHWPLRVFAVRHNRRTFLPNINRTVDHTVIERQTADDETTALTQVISNHILGVSRHLHFLPWAISSCKSPLHRGGSLSSHSRERTRGRSNCTIRLSRSRLQIVPFPS